MGQLSLSLTLITASLITLGLLITPPSSNVDEIVPPDESVQRKLRFQPLKDGSLLFVDPSPELIEQRIEEEFDQLVLSFNHQIEKNMCINGIDPQKLTTQQHYMEFLQGPCAPIVVVPGIQGTSLQVSIDDCEKFKTAHPQMFKGCGWSTCTGWGKPNKEYRLWISSPFDPMRILELEKSATCFGDLLSLFRDETREPKHRYTSPAGISVTWVGNTAETKKSSQCGVNAIVNLGGGDIINKEMSCSTAGFAKIIELLDGIGMMNGLTYQSIPYDWRLNLIAGETQTTIPRSIKALYKNTGQKVVLVGHSYGTLQLLYSLNNFMTKEEQDEMVAVYMAAAPPYLGALKTIRNQMGGDSSYVMGLFGGYQLGVNFYSQVQMMTQTPSPFDLYPYNTFQRFADTEWMQLVHKRIEYQSAPNNFTSDDIPFDFLPRATSFTNCGKYETRQLGDCKTGVDDWTKNFIVQSFPHNQVIATQQSIESNLINNSIGGEEIIDWYRESLKSNIGNLTNPGVKTVIVYGAFRNTERSFVYDKNPKNATTTTQDFYFPEQTTFAAGDGTVLSNSAVIPGLQWTWENQKGFEGAQSIQLVEYCSHEKPVSQNPIYDGYDKDEAATFNQGNYSGLPCQCQEGGSLTDCEHSCFINDPYFVEFISQLIITHQPSSLLKQENKSQLLTKQEIDHIMNECPNLYSTE